MKTCSLLIQQQLYSLDTPRVMAILNVTPDSFARRCGANDADCLLQYAEKAVVEGADMLDLGGLSTRPGSLPVSTEEEWQRIHSALLLLRKRYPSIPISIDTYRAEVARRAIEEGADIINDISGGELDADMYDVVARARVLYICMHMRGTPETMQQHTDYKDLLSEIIAYFQQKVDRLHQMGVRDVVLDPGFGFAKTPEQNYRLLRPESLRTLTEVLDLPLLVGVSRKSMIYRALGITPEEALNGTTALNMVALMGGARILRVHDVKEAVETVKLYKQLAGNEKQEA